MVGRVRCESDEDVGAKRRCSVGVSLPKGIKPRDLQVYKIVREVEQEFTEKFRVIWA